MPVRYDIRYSMMYIEQQKRAQARNTCVHVRRAWENVYILFFRDLNWTFIPLIVLIVFQLKTKPSEDCSLSTNLSSYFSYQVHRLLRRKSAIRLCVFTAHKCHGNTRYTHTHTSIHTHTGYHDYYDEKMEEQDDGKEAAMKLMPRRQWMKSKSTFWNFWWEFSDCVYIFFFCCIVFSFGVLSFLSFSLMHWTWTLANEMP